MSIWRSVDLDCRDNPRVNQASYQGPLWRGSTRMHQGLGIEANISDGRGAKPNLRPLSSELQEGSHSPVNFHKPGPRGRCASDGGRKRGLQTEEPAGPFADWSEPLQRSQTVEGAPLGWVRGSLEESGFTASRDFLLLSAGVASKLPLDLPCRQSLPPRIQQAWLSGRSVPRCLRLFGEVVSRAEGLDAETGWHQHRTKCSGGHCEDHRNQSPLVQIVQLNQG